MKPTQPVSRCAPGVKRHGLPRRFAPRNDGTPGLPCCLAPRNDGTLALPPSHKPANAHPAARHCERSAAIHVGAPTQQASHCAAAHKQRGLPRRFAPRNDGTRRLPRCLAPRDDGTPALPPSHKPVNAHPAARHCERSAAIHVGTPMPQASACPTPLFAHLAHRPGHASAAISPLKS